MAICEFCGDDFIPEDDETICEDCESDCEEEDELGDGDDDADNS